MSETEAFQLMNQIFDDLDIRSGDTLYVGVDMGKLPLPKYRFDIRSCSVKKYREQFCKFLFQSLMERLGSEGTLLAPSFSYDYARNGTPYHHESSPSEVGPFTEYLRTRAGAFRSIHPLNSLVGVGKHAQAILKNVGRAGYGVRSPYMRLGEYDTKFAFLGTRFTELTYVHHLEQLYGVNYMYNKLYNTPVHKDGVVLPGPWLCFVRYLGIGVSTDLSPLETALRDKGMLKESKHWHQPMQSATIKEVDEVALALLDQDPSIFISKKIEVHIDAPGSAPQSCSDNAVHFRPETT